MTGPGFDVDPAGLAAVGARMADATATFGASAGRGGGAPVAGTATEPVLAYLEALTEAAARFAEAAQRSGEAVGQAAVGYRRGDGTAASRLGAVPVPGGGGPAPGGTR